MLIRFLMASINLNMDVIRVWSDKANVYLRELPLMIKRSPIDEQIAYACVLAGIVLVVVGFLLLLLI